VHINHIHTPPHTDVPGLDTGSDQIGTGRVDIVDLEAQRDPIAMRGRYRGSSRIRNADERVGPDDELDEPFVLKRDP